MAKQGKTSFDTIDKSGDKKNDSGKESKRGSAGMPDENLDTESEFAVNELREEKRDSQ